MHVPIWYGTRTEIPTMYSRPIPETIDTLAQDAARIIEDTDLCVCPTCEGWIDAAEGTHSIPTDHYTDMVHPILVRTHDGRIAVRADLREALWMLSNAYQSVPLIGDIVPDDDIIGQQLHHDPMTGRIEYR